MGPKRSRAVLQRAQRAGGLKLCSSEHLQMARGPAPGPLAKRRLCFKTGHFLMAVGSSAQIIFGLSREVSSQKDPLCLRILCGCFTASSAAPLLQRRLPTPAEELQPGRGSDNAAAPGAEATHPVTAQVTLQHRRNHVLLPAAEHKGDL